MSHTQKALTTYLKEEDVVPVELDVLSTLLIPQSYVLYSWIELMDTSIVIQFVSEKPLSFDVQHQGDCYLYTLNLDRPTTCVSFDLGGAAGLSFMIPRSSNLVSLNEVSVTESLSEVGANRLMESITESVNLLINEEVSLAENLQGSTVGQ